MLLAIDAGNTNTLFAVYDGDQRMAVWRLKTDSSRTSDEYTALLYPLFDLANLSVNQITKTVICSVVPDANFHLNKFCRRVFGSDALIIGHDITDYGLTLNVDKPGEVGADRVVNALAVKMFYDPPAIVIDFGTATTFDIVDKDGAYCGGAIAPGVHLSARALHQAAAKLPRISIQKPPSVIGGNTVSAMQSGLFWGYASMIEGMIVRIANEMNIEPLVIATGGLGSLFAGSVPVIDVVDEDLTLRGIVHLSKKVIA